MNRQRFQYLINRLNVPTLWRHGRGKGVTIAVIDLGIQDHPEFPISKRRASFDFLQDGLSWSDETGHGTTCAAIASANGPRMVGIAPESDLIELRSQRGLEHLVDPLDCVLELSRQIQPLILLLTSSTRLSEDPTVRTKVFLRLQKIIDAGVLVVTSAGNNNDANTNLKSIYGFKCLPKVLTIAACNKQGIALADSSRGPGELSESLSSKPDFACLVLPQTVCLNHRTMESLDKMGTSHAAAIIAGVASCVLSARPKLSSEAVRGLLLNACRDPSDVFAVGRGQLNLTVLARSM